MTGWRIGYAVGNTELIAKAALVQSQITSNASSISQYAALEAVNSDDSFINSVIPNLLIKRDKAISILNEINFEAPKTKLYVDMIANLKMDDKKTLFVVNEQNNNLYLSSRNLRGTKVVTSDRLSTYDIMESQQIVFDSAAVANTVKNLKA